MDKFKAFIARKGFASCAALWGVKERTVKSWYYGERLPRLGQAHTIVESSAGELRIEDIYAPPPGEPPRSSPRPLSTSTQGANSESSNGAAALTAATATTAAPAPGGGRKTGIADPITEIARCA